MSQGGTADLSRRKLVEKALFSIPTKDLRALLPDGSSTGNISSLPPPTVTAEIASGHANKMESSRLVPIRIAFPDLVVEKGKERAFVKELSDQLKVALPGLGEEALAASVVPREEDEEPAVVQLTLSLSRAEQLKCLLETPSLLSYTPLLRFAKLDSQFWSVKVGVTTGSPIITLPAADVIARLDIMERKYLDIKDKKSIVESFHEIMKRTNPYEVRMEVLRQLEEQEPAPIDFGGAGKSANPRYPWSGVEGVLSPRAKDPPPAASDSGYKNMIDPEEQLGAGVVRTVPPDATVVVAKNAMDTALQQLSVDGVQLSAASAEINRRLEEAVENAELTRIAAAGLVSPQVLEQLVIQSGLKREQQRQKDELRVLKAWEKDGVASVERENGMLYMQRLYALATGDDEALATLEGGDRKFLKPSDFREEKVKAQSKAVAAAAASSRRGDKLVGVSIHVVRGSNLPLDSDCFVRVRVAGAEVQTGTVSDGNWDEKLYVEYPLNAEGCMELQLYQYNSFGRDVLVSEGKILLRNVRDTDGQVGIFVLNKVAGDEASLSLRFDVDSDEREAFTQFGGNISGSLSVFRTDLQTTQNLLRERNMDYIADQVEQVEDERRRIAGKVEDHQQVVSFSGGSEMKDFSVPQFKEDSGMVRPIEQGGLKQVEKPFPTYEALYAELVALVQLGKLSSPEGRQLAYDFCYIGQAKLDFGTDPKLLDYLSLMSDVLVEYQADFPVLVTGLSTACNMCSSAGDDLNRKKQIGMVLFEAASRSLPLVEKDPLLADQVLTALSLVLVASSGFQVGDEHVDFALLMWSKVREPVQVEQVMQILGFCKSGKYRKSDQLTAISAALERFRFSPASVQRALIALSAVTSSSQSVVNVGKKSAIELVVVAAGMYADNPGIQVAAIDALSALAGASSSAAARIENLASPVIFDQSLERNKKNPLVVQSVARLILKLADLRLKEFNLPEALSVLLKIITDSSLETSLIALAALRACLSSARRESTLYNIPDTVASQFVLSLEQRVAKEASLARETCIAVEVLMGVADVREVLIKAGITVIPLKAVQAHSAEYPRLVKQFLSSLHSVVLASPKAAFQFSRLDGVQTLMNLALFGAAEWRSFAILADACCVEETRKQFSPDDDIERIISLIEKQGRLGIGDTENAVQGIRVIGEIAFNSSFSSLELFAKINDTVKVWFGGSGQVNFAFQPVIWALLNRKIPQKNLSRFERLTSPNGKDLTNPLSDSLLKEYNIWVTAQGGSQVGADVIGKTKPSEGQPATRGFLETMTDMLSN